MTYTKYLPKILSLTLIVFLGGVLVPHAVGYIPLAPLPIGEGGTIPKEYSSMGAYLAGMLRLIIAIGGVSAIVMAIIGGVQRIASGISPSAKSKANKRVENALIGLGLVLASYLILNSINPDLVNIKLDLPDVVWRNLTSTTTVVGLSTGNKCDDNAIPTNMNEPTVMALNLSPNAKAAALILKAKCPFVQFTSGRRDIISQANAMAKNITTGGGQYWIQKTYKSNSAITKLQNAVNAKYTSGNTSYSDISGTLILTMKEMSPSEQSLASKHFSGDAFDVEPSSSGDVITTIKNLPFLKQFIDNEGGLTRWHAEFN